MKFKNTTDFDDHFLRRMLSWVLQQHGLPAKRLWIVQFLNTRHAFRGTAWRSGRMIVRIGAETSTVSKGQIYADCQPTTIHAINDSAIVRKLMREGTAEVDGVCYRLDRWQEQEPRYPMERKYPGRVNAPTFMLNDRIEALVQVTAHEVAHFVRWQHTRKNREARIDGMSLPILADFREQRESLVAAWSAAPKPRATKPALTVAEKNEAKARAVLEKWQAELAKRQRGVKAAQKKVREYQTKVRRYDKIAASRGVKES